VKSWPACFASLRFDESASGQFALDKVATALEYQQRFPNSKDVYAGISINGGGVSHGGTIRGMSVNVVTEIQEGFSADIVTKPARGGRFLALNAKEAARAAEWKRKTARESRTPTRTSGDTRGRIMAVVVNKESKTKKPKGPVMKESTRLLLRGALTEVREAAAEGKPKRTLRLFTETMKLFKERGVMANEDEVKGLMRKMRAALDDGNDPMTILKDVQTDLGALGKALAGGGAKPEAEHEDPNAPQPKPGLAAEGEGEGEAEAEGEGEGEAEAEGEGEAETEGETAAEDETGETEDAAAENEGDESAEDDAISMTPVPTTRIRASTAWATTPPVTRGPPTRTKVVRPCSTSAPSVGR